MGSLAFVVWMSESDISLVRSEQRMYAGEGGLRDGRVTGKATPDFQTQYTYTSAWSVDSFIDAFNELLDTAIGVLVD